MATRIKFSEFLLILLSLGFVLSSLRAQTLSDFVFFKNFVRHSEGGFCNHQSPEAAFTVYLNGNENILLTENAPRWDQSAEPNLPGNGTFGIELGNFAQPSLAVGDSVFIRFTCSSTSQQAKLDAKVAGITWYYFPATLNLNSLNLPDPPQGLGLAADSSTFYRTLTWNALPGLNYLVYRRTCSDTIQDGRCRMLYHKMAEVQTGNSFIDSTALAGEKYGYIIYAVNGSGLKSSHSREINEDPIVHPGMDLTIRYIARLPKIPYTWGSPEPGLEGWPPPGSPVTWRAVVTNWSDSALSAVPFRWAIDGIIADSGTVNIPASDTAYADLPWNWTFDRHEIVFVIDSKNLVAEEEEENNRLLIYSNAITAGFYVEESVNDYFHQYQEELGVRANSWEDWAQRHLKTWNEMFAAAQFPDSPNGVLDRIRLDKITIIPDGALPLHGGLPSNNPNLNDRTVDLQWGFPASLLNGTFYANHSSTSPNNPFYFEGSLLHELGHARYLIDLYGFNVHDDGTGNAVAIRENGQLIINTPYLPLVGGAVYFGPINGLMNGQYTYVDKYSAVALNLITGHRAVLGNYNAPGNIGVFLQDLPQQNRLVLKNTASAILDNADVKIYRAGPKTGEWYGKYYDDIPDLQLTADNGGAVLLGRCPFAGDGVIRHTYGHANGVVILRVAHNGKVGYGFLEVTSFNMEYWRGNTTVGIYELKVNMIESTAIGDEEQNQPGREFILSQNYPNPFNPETLIRYYLPWAAGVEISVFNTLGEEIITLKKDFVAAGEHQVKWNGRDAASREVASGIYLYRLSAGEHISLTGKMLLLR